MLRSCLPSGKNSRQRAQLTVLPKWANPGQWITLFIINPVLVLSLVLSRSGFCSTDRFHGNGPIHVFLFWSKAGKFNICNSDSEKKNCEICHSSHWNYQQKLKRLNFLRNFKDWSRRWTFFKCKPPEVHFTIRNRVPYNKLLTNRACSVSKRLLSNARNVSFLNLSRW